MIDKNVRVKSPTRPIWYVITARNGQHVPRPAPPYNTTPHPAIIPICL